MTKEHAYTAEIVWTGDRGAGTEAYDAYDRTWSVETPDKPVIHCSNDPLLGGDPSLPNPEDLLLCSLAACHMLWYLHLASRAGIVVRAYTDAPVGVGETAPGGFSAPPCARVSRSPKGPIWGVPTPSTTTSINGIS